MHEQYTPDVQRAILFAKYEASELGLSQIETERLLLGLVRVNLEFVNRFLPLKVSEEFFDNQVMLRSPLERSGLANMFDMPFSDESKRVLSFAREEADRWGSKHIGAEHLLLGLVHEEGCLAAQMLRERGAEIEQIRKALATTPPANSPESQRSRSLDNYLRALRKKARMMMEQGGYTVVIANGLAVTTDGPIQNSQETGASRGAFERYTERGRRAIFFARYEASQFGSPVVETEHLLLGVLREDKLHLNLLLPSADSIEAIREKIEERSTERENVSTNADLPLSDECERALAYAEKEAANLGRQRIGPEHLLLGLLREQGSFAAQLLRECGAEIERIRSGVAARYQQPPSNPGDPSLPSSSEPAS